MTERALRWSIIGLTTMVTLVVYGIIRWLWVLPIANTGDEEEVIGWAAVTILTLAAGFGSWGVYSLLRRFGRVSWWPIIGIAVLAISLLGPINQAEGSSRTALIVLHFVAGVPLILGFTRPGCGQPKRGSNASQLMASRSSDERLRFGTGRDCVPCRLHSWETHAR